MPYNVDLSPEVIWKKKFVNQAYPPWNRGCVAIEGLLQPCDLLSDFINIGFCL